MIEKKYAFDPFATNETECACLGGKFTVTLGQIFECLMRTRASREDIREKSPCKGILIMDNLTKSLNEKCGFSMDRTKIIQAAADTENPTNSNIDKAFHKLNALTEEFRESCKKAIGN